MNTLQLRRLSRIETARIEALADAVDQALAAVLQHVDDEALRLIVDDKLGLADAAQWYAYLVEHGAPAEQVEKLRRADTALWPHVESPAYQAWLARSCVRWEAILKDGAPARV